MTEYVALPATATLKQDSDQLRENLRNAVKAPQNTLCEAVAIEFIDVILQNFMYDMIEQTEMSSFQEGLVRNLASVVKKTTHTIVHKVIGKMSNAEMVNLVEYIEDRELVIEKDGVPSFYVAFPLEEATRQQLHAVFAEVEAGRGEQHKKAYHAAMQAFIEQSLHYFMELPLSYMKLGRIMHTMVNVAFTTIRKAQEFALSKSIPALSNTEMQEHIAHMRKLMLVVED